MKRYDAIAKRLPKTRKLVGVEVGVWKARNAAELLELRPKLKMYCVDRWKAYTAEERARDTISQQPRAKQGVFDGAKRRAIDRLKPYGARAEILEMSSGKAAERFDDAALDFVFLDGDHSYEGVKADIAWWLPKVKPGGFLAGHDYKEKNKRPGILKAVDEAFGNRIETDIDSTWFYEVKDAKRTNRKPAPQTHRVTGGAVAAAQVCAEVRKGEPISAATVDSVEDEAVQEEPDRGESGGEGGEETRVEAGSDEVC